MATKASGGTAASVAGGAGQAKYDSPEYKAQKAREDRAAFLAQQALYRNERNKDLAEGRKRGEEVFRTGSLGRVGSTRSQDIQDIIAQRKLQSQGFTPEEQQGLREQNLKEIDRGGQMASRQLRAGQARSGVYGPAAAAQQALLASQGQQQKADLERQLFLENASQRRSGLGALEQSVTGAEAGELGRRQFDIGQQNKELLGKLQTELGFGSLGAGERASAMQGLIGNQLTEAANRAMAGSGGKK